MSFVPAKQQPLSDAESREECHSWISPSDQQPGWRDQPWHKEVGFYDRRTNNNTRSYILWRHCDPQIRMGLKPVMLAGFLWHLRALTALVNERPDNWDLFLEATLFSLRSKVHATTKSTPFKLMYGREAVCPSEVPVDVPVRLFES